MSSSELKPYTLNITVPGLPKRINQMSGRTWYVRSAESKKWLSSISAYATIPPNPIRRAKLTLVRFSSRCPDYDGLVSSFKHVIDALVTLRILEDDSMIHIGMPDFMWVITDRGKGKIQIIVEELFI